MALKMNMRAVRLGSTGKHLFDAPYCYNDLLQIGDAVLTRGKGCYYASRDLTEQERDELLEAIKLANEEWEQAWNINQITG